MLAHCAIRETFPEVLQEACQVDLPGRKKPYLRVVGEEPRVPQKAPPFFNVPKPLLYFAVALIAIHFVLYLWGENAQVWFFMQMAFSPMRTNALSGFPNDYGQAYLSTLTYSLLHMNATHLITNVLWLIVFGTPVARRMSAFDFFTIAAAGSVGGAIATQILQWNTQVTIIGASAAVSGLMAAAIPIMFGPGSTLSRTTTVEGAKSARILPFRELLHDRTALAFMLMFLMLTLFTGAAQSIGNVALIQDSSIAWQAHLGGFLAGLLAFYALDKGPVHLGRRM
jgi:membrane associated rhomboid family serine protease